MVLIFLASTKDAALREIERGTDMRQPEAGLTLK
jgi:predicted transcriptional regulator